MARVNIYTGTPNVIPIFEQYDKSLVVAIKEEPADDTEPLNGEQKTENDPVEDVKVPADSIATTSNDLQAGLSGGNSKSKHSKSRKRRRKKIKQTTPTDKKVIASLPNKKPSWRYRISLRELENLTSGGVATKLRSNNSTYEKKIDIHRCETCLSAFTSDHALKKHISAYDENKLMCHVCNIIIEGSEKFLNHLVENHNRLQVEVKRTYYECHHCGLKSYTKIQLTQHICHFHNPNDIKTQISSEFKCLPSEITENSMNNNSNKKKRKREKIVFTNSSNSKEEKIHETDGISMNRQSMPINNIVNQPFTDVDVAKISTPVVSIQGNRDSNEASASISVKERQLRSIKDSASQRISEDGVHQQLQGNQNKTRSSILERDGALVKVHMIPEEVQALLGNHDKRSVKKVRMTATTRNGSDLENKHAQLCTHSSPTCQELKNDSSQTQKQKIELSTNVPSVLQERSCPKEAKNLDYFQRLYDCRECHIILERIQLPKDQDEVSKIGHEFSEYSEQEFGTVQRPIELELRNLEIALKKLEVPTDSTDQQLTNKTTISIQNNDLNIEEAPVASKEVSSTTQQRNIYRSSACRTRFTTKRKLIYHYLCFHTNSSIQECGVCRTKCPNPAKLKKHLLLHCIKIIASKQDRSPIDPKEPCETFKKKYMCTGCKKHFWLSSCLKKHMEHCRFMKAKLKVKKKTTRTTADATVMATKIILQEINDNEDQNTPRITTRSARKILSQVKVINDPPVPLNFDSTDKNNKSTVTEESIVSQKEPVRSLEFIPVPYRWWIDNPSVIQQKLHACAVCNTQFQTAEDLNEHEQKFLPRDVKRCGKCGVDFPTKTLFEDHQKSSHTRESLTLSCHCPICDQGFPAKKYLRCHALHIHRGINDKAYEMQDSYRMRKKCRVCGLRFKTAKRLYEHGMYYFDEEVFNCKICDQKFFGQHRAHRHNKLVHYSEETKEIYSYHCKICKEGFIVKGHLISHILHNHNDHEAYEMEEEDDGKKQICRSCDERFESAIELIDHENEFYNDGDFKCDKCDRKCRSQSALIQHQNLTHSNNIIPGQEKCKMCPEVAQSRKALISHMKHIHTSRITRSTELCLENYLSSTISFVEILQDSNVNNKTDNLEDKLPVEIIEVHEVHEPQEENSVIGNPETEEIGEMLCDNEPDIIIEPIPPSHIEYTCAICDEKFLSMSELKTHGNTHTSRSFACYEEPKIIDISEKSNSPVEELITPMEMPQQLLNNPNEIHEVTYDNTGLDSSAPLFISDICSVQLEDYEKLTNSENVCEENILYSEPMIVLPQQIELEKVKCNDCQIEFNGHRSLENHQIRYSNTGPHMCDKCGRRFSGMKAYRTHSKRHQRRENSKFPIRHYCEPCDEVFGTTDSKRMHFAHIHKILLTPDGSQTKVPCGSQIIINTNNEIPQSSTIIGNSTLQSNNMNNMMQCQAKMERDAVISLLNLQERERGFIEEVDLTENEDVAGIDGSIASLSTPTIIFLEKKPSNARLEQLPNFQRSSSHQTEIYAPFVCHLCSVKSDSMEVLLHHLENVHRMSIPTKSIEPPSKKNSDTKGSENDCNLQGDLNCKIYEIKSTNSLMSSGGSIVERIPGIFKSHCCKICNIHFANEQSLVTHFNNAHSRGTNESSPLMGTSCSKQECTNIPRFISPKINSMNEESSKPIKDFACVTSSVPQKIRPKHSGKDVQTNLKKNIVLSKIDPTEAQKMLNLIPIQASELARFHRTLERNKQTENSDQNLLR